MKTRGAITIYHLQGQDAITRLEVYKRYNYSKVWYFDSQVAKIGQGYNDVNDIQIRIPYDENEGLDISNFSKGDIIVKGSLNLDIETQDDLRDYEIYNITSINNNSFGNNPHIHIGGK